MIGRGERRGLENSFAFSAAALVICVIGAALAVVHHHVKATLVRGMAARGFAVAQSIGAVATPSLLAYNYAALQAAAEKAVQDPDLVYVILHDKDRHVRRYGRTAGVRSRPAHGTAPWVASLCVETISAGRCELSISAPWDRKSACSMARRSLE